MPGPFGHRYAGTVASLGKDAPAFEIGQCVMGVHSTVPGLQPLHARPAAPTVRTSCVKRSSAPRQLPCHPRPGRPAEPVRSTGDAAGGTCGAARTARLRGSRPGDDRLAGVDRVLVLGLGTMGLLFAQLLPRYTAANLAGAGQQQRRVEMAQHCGLDPVADLSETTLAEQWPATEQFDVVIECTGKLEGWEEAFRRTAPGGQVRSAVCRVRRFSRQTATAFTTRKCTARQLPVSSYPAEM